MQQEPFAEAFQEPQNLTRLEYGQFTMLLHNEMTAETEGSIYFSLPDQDSALYEYDGELDEALNDLPEIYHLTATRDESQPSLTPEAAIVVEQLWNYFDQTEAQELDGEQDYNFRIEEGWLLIVPKESSEEVVAISRDGQVQSSFKPERYGHLMECCGIAHEQMQMEQPQKNDVQNWELG